MYTLKKVCCSFHDTNMVRFFVVCSRQHKRIYINKYDAFVRSLARFILQEEKKRKKNLERNQHTKGLICGYECIVRNEI